MFKLRYYSQVKGSEEILELLADVKAKHPIPYEIIDLSRNGAYDEEKERQIYERDFKPKAKILKKRTGESITQLRSRRARHYLVSIPGTIAIVVDEGIEWHAIGNGEIIKFLKRVLSDGDVFLKQCCE